MPRRTASSFDLRPLAFLACLLALACARDETRGLNVDVAAPPPLLPAELAPPTPAPERYVGDLAEIRRRGVLRILVLRSPEEYLPRSGSPLDRERRLAVALARDLRLEPRFVGVDRLDDLIPALREGRGDLVVDNFTVTDGRRQHVAFSSPVAVVREQIVTRSDDQSLHRRRDLAGRRLAVRPSSSFWESAQRLRQQVPGLQIDEAPENLDTDLLLDGVARGDFDLTLADSNLVGAALGWRDDVRVGLDLGEPRLIAWALRPGDRQLRQAVDAFLARVPVGQDARELHTEDLPDLEERGVLRVLTRNSGTTYFIWRGELLGFEYEMARRFADQRGLRLEMVVPPSRGDLVPWLLEGKGDLIAAGLTSSPERAEELRVRFSRNYLRAAETVVVRKQDPASTLEELAGRQVVVRRSSAYWKTLTRLQSEGATFTLVPAPEEMETEEIIARVADGTYDATVADSHIVDVEQVLRSDVRGAFTLGDKRPHGWAVRPGNARLLAAVDAFFDAEYRGLFYNVTKRKYFKNAGRARRHSELRVATAGRISPFDDLVRKYAQRYGFDWRLIVAQMHQESRFEPTARSFAGALGLLQVLPRTGRQFGFEQLEHPEEGVHAGVKYMAWLRERFVDVGSPTERTWLTLAAYNAGVGHVRDARRLAVERGWDPDRWFGHVEQAMLLKERPEIHRKTRFGYARGSESVEYVRSIRDRYRAYVQVAPPLAGGIGPLGPWTTAAAGAGARRR